MFQPQSDLILTLQATPIPMDQFRREFLALYEPPLASRATERKHRYVLDRLAALGAETTADLTPELVARFIKGRPPGQSAYTARSYLISLRCICNHAEGRRLVAVSPFRLRKLSKWIRVEPPRGRRHNSREEIRAILAVMRKDVETKRGWAQWRARRLLALTSLVAYTGLRLGEALTVWVEDLDLEGGILDLRPRPAVLPEEGRESPDVHLKTPGSAQPIALPSALVPVLADWLGHRLDAPEGFSMPSVDRIPWLFPGTRRQSAWRGGSPGRRPLDRLQAAGRRAGVAEVSWQRLRRSWATLAEGAGVPQALITRQCRHSSEKTTRQYYQQRDIDALRDAVGGFDI